MKRSLKFAYAGMILGALSLSAAISAQEKAKFKPTPEVKQILELTNKARAKKDLPPLKLSPILCKVAQAHSKNMAKKQKLAHILDGKTPFHRIKATGYRYRFAGENIGWGDYPIPKIFQAWMDSPLHRANILKPEYTEIGLGRVVDKTGNAWYTQVFAKPRPKR